ncbi:uncharacterized protein THITE_124786 [Thermothielavioides terrestris NRRL 8126]|uniref:Uncharacterized protein n=1 Tax=Thermothielavioides terrestris (strain ATCC 38088 / NRRL 8126) TaxID=578455 RepID=G2RGS3_THETT|nr:uncharacterized protein THITE_124786 [Thermothielavioides terrestris NRRL 8126]AEO71908.1 hypothetical protein THITE_124786 [Thermothielavioides terrestris NRRL 8126]
MLPPVEDAVLANNPEFAALYAKLTTSALNPDGSSKDDPAAKERGAVTEELNRYRLKAAKQSLLLDAIANANPQSLQAKPAPAPTLTKRPRAPQQATSTIAELPAPLLDLLLLLPPLLTASSELSPESTALLLSNPPLSDFPDHLPQLAALVSNHLHTSAVHLARIANPSTNPSFVHRAVPSLPTSAASLTATIADRKADLTRARLAAAASLSSLLASQTAVLAQLLRALEAKHGAVARSLELRAAEAALAAQRQHAEAEAALWLARRDAYPPAAQRALANYARHLRDARARLNEAVHTLRAELEAYGVDSVAAGTGRSGRGRQGEGHAGNGAGVP